jgi:DHA1 family inner membrane transport protein
VVAADLVPRNQRASAIALMFTGLTLANVLGVPLGTALGQVAGWRSTFWVVSGIGLLAVAALAAWLPARIPMQPGNILREFKVLRDVRVVWPLAASVLASAALFCVLTYIAPLLREVTGVSERGVTGVLLLFGVALTVGSTLGGKLGDRNLEVSLRRIFIGLLLVFLALSQAIHALAPMLVMTFIWGVLGFAVVPLLQTLIVDQAADAPNLASTLNQGAFNLGNAGGAWLGSVALGHGLPLTDLPWMSAGITAAVLLLTLWGTRYYGRDAGATLAGQQAGALTPSRSDA